MEENNEVLLISVEKACKSLNISKGTLRKIIKSSKDFPALIFPHKILIDKQALPHWIRVNYGRFK